MNRFLKNNSLSIVFFLLFLISMVGQFITGWKVYNNQQKEVAESTVTLINYLTTGHFIQSTFENWESEFLQMALFVILTVSLRQKGSSESKGFDGPEEVDREPSKSRKDVPWAVKQGGWILYLYKRSLSIALLLLFLLSFLLHFHGSLRDENEKLMQMGLPAEGPGQYLFNPRLWFESFQNWQSEFLSVFAIVILSVFLRQKGSPQSKPVDAPHSETGE